MVLGQEEEVKERKDGKLEVIQITAQHRTQSIQEVPISIATLNGEQFENIFSGGEDIIALAVRIPGLYAETSNGRAAPRFYIRGLGNTDFDLAASQPVSIVMDDVVKDALDCNRCVSPSVYVGVNISEYTVTHEGKRAKY